MFHYVYKTTFTPTGQFYIGLRSSKTHPSLDKYRGSGAFLKIFFKKWKNHKTYWRKEIIAIFNTREEASNFETSLVTSTVIANPLNLNIAIGGGRKEGVRKKRRRK